MDTKKNRKINRPGAATAITVVALSLLMLTTAACIRRTYSTSSVERKLGDTALAVMNQQNVEKYVLIKTTLQELAALSGPIHNMQEGRKMPVAEELQTRIKMIKSRIETLEAMATDSTDTEMVRSLTTMLNEKETEIVHLKKIVAQQGTTIDRQGQTINQQVALLEKNNELLQKQYDDIEQKNRALERKNQTILNQRQDLAQILYMIGNDYMRMGNISFHDLTKKNSAELQRICFDNARKRYEDAQKYGYGNCSAEIGQAASKRNAVK